MLVIIINLIVNFANPSTPSTSTPNIIFYDLPIIITVKGVDIELKDIKLRTDESTGNTNVWVRTNLSAIDLSENFNNDFPIVCLLVADDVQYEATRRNYGLTEKIDEMAIWFYFDTDKIPSNLVLFPINDISDRYIVECVNAD